MSDGPYGVCERCRRRLDRDDPTNIPAVEIHDLPGMGQAHDFVEGRNVTFHAECFPERSTQFKRRAD